MEAEGGRELVVNIPMNVRGRQATAALMTAQGPGRGARAVSEPLVRHHSKLPLTAPFFPRPPVSARGGAISALTASPLRDDLLRLCPIGSPPAPSAITIAWLSNRSSGRDSRPLRRG